MSKISTISFYEFDTIGAKFWMFTRMGLWPLKLSKINGSLFQKLMGTGSGNGFSIWPDFGTYSFFSVWDSEESAKEFFASNPYHKKLSKNSSSHFTIFLKSAGSHGMWNGKNPFETEMKISQELPVAVITRASIRPSKLYGFWKNVPTVSKAIEEAKGLYFRKGIGELPLVEQATFSVWKNLDAVKEYAYKGALHNDIIQQTREKGWYSEELFARFIPYGIEGDVPEDLRKGLNF
jgi:heme-degrading monooxygenase HmoA